LVVMAAGDEAYLAQDGSGVWVEYHVNPMDPSTNVVNSGTIETGDNGRVMLASGDAFSKVIGYAGLFAAAPSVGPKHTRKKNHQGYTGKSYHTTVAESVINCNPKPDHYPKKPYQGPHPKGKPNPCPKPNPDPPNPPNPPGPPDPPNPPDIPGPPEPPDQGPGAKYVFPYIAAAPVPEKMELEYSGYPALVKWVAKELGIDERAVIDIWITGALASPRHIQPYEMYAKLRKDALILRDETGSYVSALARLIGGYASSATPPTEEQMASIADAIANNTVTGNDYAIAGQYLDALTEYVDILGSEVGFSADKAVEFVTTKYVDRLAQGDNVHVAAYISVRLASLKGRLVARDL